MQLSYDQSSKQDFNKRKVVCDNCSRRLSADKAQSPEEYQESDKFKAYDRMMRQNRGIQLPGNGSG